MRAVSTRSANLRSIAIPSTARPLKAASRRLLRIAPNNYTKKPTTSPDTNSPRAGAESPSGVWVIPPPPTPRPSFRFTRWPLRLATTTKLRGQIANAPLQTSTPRLDLLSISTGCYSFTPPATAMEVEAVPPIRSSQQGSGNAARQGWDVSAIPALSGTTILLVLDSLYSPAIR